jgi:hypothetical protein
MISLRRSASFEKAIRRLGPEQAKRAAKSLTQFLENPRHPHLHFERLGGTPYLTIKADNNFRIIMRESGKDVFDLVDVVDHNTMKQQYGRNKR